MELMQYLVASHGVDPNVKDNNGWTPLHCACHSANWEVRIDLKWCCYYYYHY